MDDARHRGHGNRWCGLPRTAGERLEAFIGATMRNTDPTETKPWQPLGERVVREAPKPAPAPPPRGPYGVIVGDDGKLKTTRNPNP